jgi:gamma-glutamylcyclotransferase
MDSWYYFAYGSNLHQAQLIARCNGRLSESNEPPRIARLPNYRLAFNMDGGDGEVYANIAMPGDGVMGVIYRCSEAAFALLDVYETGYNRIAVLVADEQGRPLPAIAYVAQLASVTVERRPHEEYLQIILSGAREHSLPAEYIRQIEAIASGRADAGDGSN